MTYFESNKVPKSKTLPLIGEEVQLGVIGSTSYFIKSFESTEAMEWLENSKGIFQIFKKGVLLRVFKSNKTISIPILFTEINKLELCKGKETIRPIFLSPFWILLTLGVRTDIARYFRIKFREYSIAPTRLRIETRTFQIGLETNGYTFESQKDFFESLTEIKNLKISQPAPNSE